MKLKGYIKAIKENCFAIPIYGDGTSYYYHNISNDFKILSFEKTEISQDYFIQAYLSKTFDINSTATLIFVGFENYHLYNSADQVIDEVIFYLKDNTEVNEYLNIKKEVFELKTIITSDNLVNTNEEFDIKNFVKELKKGADDISLFPEAYVKLNENILRENLIELAKEKIIKKQIENSIVNDQLFNTNKEVIFTLFHSFLSENKSIFEKLIIDSNIGKSFTSYLNNKSETYKPVLQLDLSIEESLILRAEERRRKLKDFNYQFQTQRYNYKNELAYKRFGIDITTIPNLIKTENAKFIIFIDDKMISEEIKQIETEKANK